MRRFFVATVLALALVGFGAGTAEAQSVRFGYVNSQRLLAQAPGAGEAEKTLQKEVERYGQEIDALENELERMGAELERQKATLKPAEREQRQQAFQQKYAQYQRRTMELEQAVQKRRAELAGPIMKRIAETVDQVRKEGKYVMIVDEAAAGPFFSADPSLDLTDRVLAKLRSK